MSNALFVIVLFYCTSQNSCWSVRPENGKIYGSRIHCAEAIAEHGRDFLNPHFRTDETDLVLTCTELGKQFSPWPVRNHASAD